MRRGPLIACCFAAAVLGSAAAVTLVAIVSFHGLGARDELTLAEKALLVQIDDVSALGLPARDDTYLETFKAKHNLDGSLELEYRYESDSTAAPVNVISEAEICRHERSARESFEARVSAYNVAFRIKRGENLSLEQQASLFGLGDEHFAARLKRDGKPMGILVVAREKLTVYSLILMQVLVDEQDDLHTLLRPKLELSGSVTVP